MPTPDQIVAQAQQKKEVITTPQQAADTGQPVGSTVAAPYKVGAGEAPTVSQSTPPAPVKVPVGALVAQNATQMPAPRGKPTVFEAAGALLWQQNKAYQAGVSAPFIGGPADIGGAALSSAGQAVGFKTDAGAQWNYLKSNPAYTAGDVMGQAYFIVGSAIGIGEASKILQGVAAGGSKLAPVAADVLKVGGGINKVVGAPFSLANAGIEKVTGVDVGERFGSFLVEHGIVQPSYRVTTGETLNQGIIAKTDVEGNLVGSRFEEITAGTQKVSPDVAANLKSQLTGLKNIQIEATGMQSTTIARGGEIVSDVSKVAVSHPGLIPTDYIGRGEATVLLPAGPIGSSEADRLTISSLFGTENLDTKALLHLEPEGQNAIERGGYLVKETPIRTVTDTLGGESRIFQQNPLADYGTRISAERELDITGITGERELPENPFKMTTYGRNLGEGKAEVPMKPFEATPEEWKPPAEGPGWTRGKGPTPAEIAKAATETTKPETVQLPKIGGKPVIGVSEYGDVSFLRYPGEISVAKATAQASIVKLDVGEGLGWSGKTAFRPAITHQGTTPTQTPGTTTTPTYPPYTPPPGPRIPPPPTIQMYKTPQITFGEPTYKPTTGGPFTFPTIWTHGAEAESPKRNPWKVFGYREFHAEIAENPLGKLGKRMKKRKK